MIDPRTGKPGVDSRDLPGGKVHAKMPYPLYAPKSLRMLTPFWTEPTVMNENTCCGKMRLPWSKTLTENEDEVTCKICKQALANKKKLKARADASMQKSIEFCNIQILGKVMDA